MRYSLKVRISRAASVLLSDPCFQLHSIQHLLGEGGEPAGSSTAAAPSPPPVVGPLGAALAPAVSPGPGAGGPADRKHFSLHAYTDYISEEEERKVEGMLAFLTEESKQAAASTATDQYRCELLGLTSTAVSYYGALHLNLSITPAPQC
ncbi:unnamed protein product [Arctogadus glacialis]